MQLPLGLLVCAATVVAQTVPKAYFVQLHRDQQVESEDLVQKAADRSIPLTIRYAFEDFNSLSVVLEDEAHVDLLRGMSEVESVFPVRTVTHGQNNAVSRVSRSRGTQKRDSRGSRRQKSTATGISARQTNGTLDLNAPHHMTGVDHLHEQGILGAGVRVAIIDTGIDWTHPALGGCFGPGCKVAFGYDFVGDAYGDTTFDPQPKDDPMPGCWEGFHGTHVAGIVGMQSPVNGSSGIFDGLRGVAPAATLGMYRVFGCSGSASDDTIVAAMQQAVRDGADVVSMSIGEVGTWDGYPGSTLPAAVRVLREKGIAVIAAGGNSGEIFSTNLPGNADDALAVASVENAQALTYEMTDSDGVSLRYASIFPLESGEYNVVWAGNQSEAAEYKFGCAVSDYPSTNQLDDDQQYIVAVRRGESCAPTQVQYYAMTANYSAVVMYPDPTVDDVFVEGYAIPTPTLTAEERVYPFVSTVGDTLYEASKNGDQSYTLTVSDQSRPMMMSQIGGGKPNNFSSIGPTADFKLKPQISAPGGTILSTFPTSSNSPAYGIISGTSMATPYITGVYALIKSQHPALSIDEIWARIQTTSSLVDMTAFPGLAPALLQGAGLVQANRAIANGSTVTPGERSANDYYGVFSIENPSGVAVTYTLSNIPANGMAVYPEGSTRPNDTGYTDSRYLGLTPLPFSASVQFEDGESVTLAAGETRNLTFQVVPPTGLNPNDVPIYSGFVSIHSSTNESFSIPYFGPAYNYTSVPVIGDEPLPANSTSTASNRSAFSVPLVFSANDSAQQDIGNYHIFSFSGPDYPVVTYTLAQPVQVYRLDVVRASTTFKPTHYGFDPAVTFANLTEPVKPDNGTVGGVSLVGTVDIRSGVTPTVNAQAVWNVVVWDVDMKSSIGLKRGSYRILARWLRFGGDAGGSEEGEDGDWVSWMSGVIDVLEDIY